MEEVKRRSLVEDIRRRIAGAFLPGSLNKLEELEHSRDDLTLRLQRVTQQRNRLEKDVGLMKATTWTNLLMGDYNPEEVNMEEYVKMMNYDAQVRAGFDLIEMGVLMKPWRIRHPDEKVVDILTAALQRMRQPSIRDSMKEMLGAIAYGYSVTEIVFDDYKGKYWMPRKRNGLKTFDPAYIKFFSDEYGSLKKIEQQIAGVGGYPELPLDRTLVWSHGKKYGNWYGESILRACYKNWFIKDAMLKFANIAYEQFGSPILLGFASTLKDQESVQEAIEHLYARSSATLLKRDKDDPANITILESKKTEMPFDRYIRFQNEMILRRMLIGQNLFEGGGGVYGAKVPFDIILMRFEDFRLELIETMNELLAITSDLNWSLDFPPIFDFAPLTTSDVASLKQSIFDALDREILDPVTDKEYIRRELGFPAEKKARQFSKALPGRYLPDPHAAWLASGKKTIIMGTSPHSQYANSVIYIVGEGGIYGTMKEGSPEGPFTRDAQRKYHLLHLLSEEEWNDRWSDSEKFWIWRPQIVQKFETPLNYTLPEGLKVYIKKVIPEGMAEEED